MIANQFQVLIIIVATKLEILDLASNPEALCETAPSMKFIDDYKKALSLFIQ